MNPLEKRHQNDVEGLRLVDRFGMLRAFEIGPMLWPTGVDSASAANRLMRSWIERKLVIVRDLPAGAGRAVVLATRGVQLLAADGVKAVSGKDIGRIKDGVWIPPESWRHDLLATGILLRLKLQHGFDEVLPERSIRRLSTPLEKWPDGLAVRRSTGHVAWLEVERAKKTGAPLEQLAEATCVVVAGTAPRVLGHKPNTVLVGLDDAARDTRGYKLDHASRVRTAVAKAARGDTEITFAHCKLNTVGGVIDMRLQSEIIAADDASKVLRVLDANGWQKWEDTGLQSHYGRHQAIVSFEEDLQGWAWSVNNELAQIVKTEALAKRSCATAIAMLLWPH